jgi:cysteine desulfurase
MILGFCQNGQEQKQLYNRSSMRLLYLDHNASSPLLPEAAEAMASAQSRISANPASQHWAGRRARQVLEDAREGIADLLGADLGSARGDRLIFTCGGTEANNLALLGIAGGEAADCVISAIEHPSVVGPADWLKRRGWQVSRLLPTANGDVEVDQLRQLIHSATRFVSVMLGNNETGVLQPVDRLSAICNEAGILLHTDAVQVAGKLPIDFHCLGVSAMTISAHKFHGPAGIGALIVKRDVDLQPLMQGGFQQGGLRPGTEPVVLAVGMHVALENWKRNSEHSVSRLASLRDQFERELLAACPELIVNGALGPRLPQTSNIAFVGLDAQDLVMSLDLAGVACSTGSACASGSTEPSPTLVSMGLPKKQYRGSIRFSFGRDTTPDDVTESVQRIVKVYKDLRQGTGPRKIVEPRRIASGNRL